MPVEIEISPFDKLKASIAGKKIIENVAFPERVDLEPELMRYSRKEKRGRFPIQNTVERVLSDIHSCLFSDVKGKDREIIPSDSSDEIWHFGVVLWQGCLNNIEKALYDKEGKLVKLPEQRLTHLLAETYLSIAREKPFAYGNQETAIMFCVVIAKAAQEHGRIFDFNSLTKEDQRLLYGEFKVANIQNDMQALEDIFRRVRQRSEEKTEEKSEWGVVENSHYTDGSGVCYRKTLAGEEYLLLENGGLVALEEVIKSGMSLENYSIHRDEIRHYAVPERENPSTTDRIPHKEHIKLFRGDIDHLTGLTEMELKTLDSFLKAVKEAEPALCAKLKDYVDIPACKDDLDRVGQDIDGYNIMVKAYGRLYYTASALLAQIEAKTSSVTAVEKPEYIFTIGGSGAGKGHLIDFSRQRIGENYIFASLDAAREYSDIWLYNVGHEDDYRYLGRWATIIRERLMDSAYEGRKHLIRDCSGAPYKREADLIMRAKADGRPVTALAITANIELAYKRAQERFEKDHRAVPAKILIEKHVMVSREFTQYLENDDINVLQLYDNNTKATLLIGEVREVSGEDLWALKIQRDNKEVDFLTMTSDKEEATQRIFVVYNGQALQEFAKKGAANEKACAPRELWQDRLPLNSVSSALPIKRMGNYKQALHSGGEGRISIS